MRIRNCCKICNGLNVNEYVSVPDDANGYESVPDDANGYEPVPDDTDDCEGAETKQNKNKQNI